ncbi:hypothetical protein HY503_00115 [Candidatus Woesebacteria bacterium]|nr:hypothetical protein [Candidatus Woesebacteria bacterium]
MLSSIAVSLLTLNILFSPSSISLNTSPTPRGQTIRQQIQVRNEERRATMEARLTLIRRERLRNFFNRLIRRLEAAIARLERLIARIESRIAKMEGEDIDTAPITKQVNDAKALLADAKEELAKTKDNFEDLLSSDKPRVVFKQVRENIGNIKKMLKEVHRILVHVVGDIKGLRVGPLP